MENKMPEGKELSLDDMINIDRWLLNRGMISESVKQNLLGYGYLAHGKALDVEVAIDAENKVLFYKISLSKRDARKYLKIKKKLDKYKQSNSVLSKLLQLRLLKKYAKYNLEANLTRFMKDFLPEFKVEVEVERQAEVPAWMLMLLSLTGSNKDIWRLGIKLALIVGAIITTIALGVYVLI